MQKKYHTWVEENCDPIFASVKSPGRIESFHFHFHEEKKSSFIRFIFKKKDRITKHEIMPLSLESGYLHKFGGIKKLQETNGEVMSFHEIWQPCFPEKDAFLMEWLLWSYYNSLEDFCDAITTLWRPQLKWNKRIRQSDFWNYDHPYISLNFMIIMTKGKCRIQITEQTTKCNFWFGSSGEITYLLLEWFDVDSHQNVR